MTKVFHFHERSQRRRVEVMVPAQPAEPEHARKTWSERRIAIYVAAVALLLLIVLVEFARAGGPQYVAGVSYFNAGLAGQAVTWTGGAISYYTDQGSLSPILAGPDADAFVADAFSRWTTTSTAAGAANRAGQLSEDVSGANVILNPDRTITLPLDIQPTAVTKPVAMVYDADGQVADALIGAGASSDCSTNAAFGGVDAFSIDGHFAHALVVLDGRCAQTSSALPDMKYHLVRMLGQVFGLGWSQLNLNAITGSPHPTQDDLAGFPVMHEPDLPSCTPVSICYPNADQPKMDDRAALAALSRDQRQCRPILGQTDFCSEHRPHSWLGQVHGCQWKSHPAHAGRQRGGALDRSRHWPAVGTLHGCFGVGFSVCGECRKRDHWIQRRARQSLQPLRFHRSGAGGLLRPGRTRNSDWRQRAVPAFGGGDSFQTVRVGETFQPIWVRVTNSATPPHPVMGVAVVFQSMIFLPDADAPVETSRDDGSSQHAMKVLLGSSQNTSDHRCQRPREPVAFDRGLLAPAGGRDYGQRGNGGGPAVRVAHAAGDCTQSRREHRESAGSGATEGAGRRGRRASVPESAKT
jgi:hypothetical protein